MVDDVTVLLPVKNGEREDWLKEAIGSLSKGLQYLLLRNDGELADALNTGLREVKTEFVFVMNADDVLHPNCLDFLRDLVWDVDVTYPTLVLTDEDLKPKELLRAPFFCSNRLQVKNYIPGAFLARTEALKAIGGWREFPLLEDWDVHVRLSRAGYRYKNVPEAYYLYRQHKNSRNKVPVETARQVVADIKKQVVGEEPDLKATFYYQATPATTYWRCLLPARYLPAQALDYEQVFLKEDTAEFPHQRGAAVYQFPGDASRAVEMVALQEQGFRTLVEVDDSYLEKSPWGNNWVDKIKIGKHSRDAHKKIVERCADGVIVTTSHLAKRYGRHNPNIYVCPNQIDPVDWELEEKPNDGILRIGWFASPSHVMDAKLVRRALEWAADQKDVEVLMMGFDPGWNFPRKQVPWSNDMGVYRKIIQRLDIGLAPLVENPWSVCKSDLKAIEYGMAKVFPVLSSAIPYETYEGPCRRASDARAFFHTVKSLVQNRDELPKLQQEAHDYVLAERTMEKNIWRWAEAIEG